MSLNTRFWHNSCTPRIEKFSSFSRNLSNMTAELKKKKKFCVTSNIHGMYQQLWDLALGKSMPMHKSFMSLCRPRFGVHRPLAQGEQLFPSDFKLHNIYSSARKKEQKSLGSSHAA